VGVVHDHGEVLSGVHELETPRNPLHREQTAQRDGGVEAERERGGEAGQEVLDVEAADERRLDVEVSPRRVGAEPRALERERDAGRGDVGLHY
jgi:hypothetical protein